MSRSRRRIVGSEMYTIMPSRWCFHVSLTASTSQFKTSNDEETNCRLACTISPLTAAVITSVSVQEERWAVWWITAVGFAGVVMAMTLKRRRDIAP
ncbi:hypothetical protein EKI51_00090 [Corynebacterium sanguinis]|uniref:hypothetical protein n=1 Tax=Corynebacterium sanguinis TaxID=2594913 RepID=UPI0011A15DA3|nr:hypothetical protein [Corynebacterium sanguinis]TVS25841.1 hypothetical protein EKI51_00090 [Corynebacterium sanguinis]